MEEIPFIIYSLLAVALPALAVFALCTRYRTTHKLTKGSESVVSILVLSVYIAMVFYFTGAGTLFDLLRTGFEYRPHQINLMPLLLDSYTMQYVLNVVMFIPLGYLISYLWPSMARVRYMILYGMGLSLLIELSQLLNQRATDIDDLIMNTIGALLGLALFKLFGKKRAQIVQTQSDSLAQGSAQTPSLAQLQAQASAQSFSAVAASVVPTASVVSEAEVAHKSLVTPSPALPALYLGVMFAGNFFLCNTLGLAALIYGF